MSRTGLAEFERWVMAAILRLCGHGYSVSITDEITKRQGKSVNIGAVYATLDRLERKGFISSRLGEPTPERGGKPKRLYAISAPGQRVLSEAQEADVRLWADLPPAEVPA